MGLETHRCFLHLPAREGMMRGLRGSQVLRDAGDRTKHPRVPKSETQRAADSGDSEDEIRLTGEMQTEYQRKEEPLAIPRAPNKEPKTGLIPPATASHKAGTSRKSHPRTLHHTAILSRPCLTSLSGARGGEGRPGVSIIELAVPSTAPKEMDRLRNFGLEEMKSPALYQLGAWSQKIYPAPEISNITLFPQPILSPLKFHTHYIYKYQK